MSSFFERLKQLRTEAGLTQEDLAKKLNLSPSTISLYESNTREPNISTLIGVANYFGVSTDYLLGISELKTKSNIDNIIKAVIDTLYKQGKLKQ